MVLSINTLAFAINILAFTINTLALSINSLAFRPNELRFYGAYKGAKKRKREKTWFLASLHYAKVYKYTFKNHKKDIFR